jgi:tetratricopeptide (TPR) repeat protein
VASLSPGTLRPNVRPRLLALARKELIRADRAEFAGEDAFRFRHLLIRDAAYQAMPKELRADLHERFATWLEAAAGERVHEYEEILGYHLEQAYRYRIELGPADEGTRALGQAAATRLMSAAERASERDDTAAAISLLRGCAEIADGALRAAALTELGNGLAEQGNFAEAVGVADDAIEAANEAGDPRQALRAELVRIRSRQQTESTYLMREAQDDLDRVRRGLDDLGDAEGGVRALLLGATLAFWAGRCAEAVRTSREALGRQVALRMRDRVAVVQLFFVWGYFGPAPVSEIPELKEQVERLVGGSLSGEIWGVLLELALDAMLGRADDAREQAERAVQIRRELGTAADLEALEIVGETARLLGDLDRAEGYLRWTADALDALGETAYNSTITAILALVLCDQGRFDEAEPFAARSRELGAEDDFATQAGWRMASARILSERGEHDEALALAERAVEIMEPTDYLTLQAEGHEVHAIALAAAGRLDEARAAYGAALELFERKGVVPAIARIRERLAALD